MKAFYYTDTLGIMYYPDGRIIAPRDAVDKINALIKENTNILRACRTLDIKRQTDITALRHDLEVAEYERNSWKLVALRQEQVGAGEKDG